MDKIDRKICEAVQRDGKISSAELAKLVGLPPSTANDRLRRLVASGVISGWQGTLDPDKVGAPLCAFMLIDMTYEGEHQAVAKLAARPEVMELHHVSGAHSFLAKVRVKDMQAFQDFLTDGIKPLGAVHHTETIMALETVKETSAVKIDIGDD